jgi:hypothetical protein
LSAVYTCGMRDIAGQPPPLRVSPPCHTPLRKNRHGFQCATAARWFGAVGVSRGRGTGGCGCLRAGCQRLSPHGLSAECSDRSGGTCRSSPGCGNQSVLSATPSGTRWHTRSHRVEQTTVSRCGYNRLGQYPRTSLLQPYNLPCYLLKPQPFVRRIALGSMSLPERVVNPILSCNARFSCLSSECDSSADLGIDMWNISVRGRGC